MAVTFILGRAGAGKTRTCLDAILEALARPDGTGRLLLLVPEQASFQMERALATRAPGGGYWRAEVLSFSRLAWRVLAQTGPEPEVLRPGARALALRQVTARCAGALGVLRQAARTAGFYAQLDALIEELLREGVTPAELAAAGQRLEEPDAAAKVADVARLYAEYMTWLGPGRVDPAARLAVLRARLEGLAWLRSACVWVDGFAGFTGQELATLVSLARTARDVAITLLVDPASPAVRRPQQAPDVLSLFERTERTYQVLDRLLAEAGVAVAPPVLLQPGVPPRFAAAPALAALEAGLATPLAAQAAPDAAARGPGLAAPGEVALYQCATQRDELRAAARWIRAQVAESGGRLRFRDFAVIARELEPLAERVAEVFGEYELPYFLDRRRPLRAHPLHRLVAGLLDAVRADFDVKPMVQLLRTRLLPLERDEAEQLENLVVRHAVRGAAAWVAAEWTLERGQAPVAALPAQRARIVAGLAPLADLARSGTAPAGSAWAQGLHAALTALSVRPRLEQWIAEARAARRWEAAELHRLAWEALATLLEDLHAALGETPLSAGDVAAIVSSTLAETTVGLAPPTVDQVLVGAIERSRHPDIQYAWVLGFNEGVFPAPPPEDRLLSGSERAALVRAGLSAPAPHRSEAAAERLLAYIALTRPSRGLVISYATVGEDGQPLLPSPLLADVQRALPGLVARRPDPDGPPVCLPELARGALGPAGDERQARARERCARLAAELQRRGADGGRLGWLLRGRGYANRPAPVGNYRVPREAPPDVAWDGSPSELETYIQCPFRHFAEYGLRLDPQRAPRPQRWDLGSDAHELLAEVTRRALASPGGVRGAAPEQWQAWLDEAAAELRRREPPDLPDRRPDLAALGRVLVGRLRDVVAVHAERWCRGRFEPLYCEQEFDPRGRGGALRGLELALPDGRRIWLHGRIDRVDVCRDGERPLALVYDYKSRVEPSRGALLTGHHLQLAIYLAAAAQGLAEAGIAPGGMLAAPLYPDLGALAAQYAAGADALVQKMIALRPRGLFSAEAAERLDPQLGTDPSPVAQIRRRADGGLYRNCDAVPAEQIAGRLELARRTVLLAAEGLVAGAIDVAPLVEKRTLACRTCEFAAVCRFDRALNRPRAAERVLPRPAEEEGPPAEGDE